jgi:c-di-GMP-binding flagellar brake protein YcgR
MDGASNNKRRKRRLPARPIDASEASSPTRPYRILDISPSGCSVETSSPLGAVESAIPIELPVPKRVDKAVLRAKIVWKGEGKNEERTCYRYGLSFEEMDPDSHQRLDRYLDFLRRDLHVNQLDQAWRKLKTPRPK